MAKNRKNTKKTPSTAITETQQSATPINVLRSRAYNRVANRTTEERALKSLREVEEGLSLLCQDGLLPSKQQLEENLSRPEKIDLRFGNRGVYSIKLNKKERVIFTFVEHNGRWKPLLLAYLPNHKYNKLDDMKLDEIINKVCSLEDRAGSEEEKGVELFPGAGNSVYMLSEEQQQVRQALIGTENDVVLGMAGSGKTSQIEIKMHELAMSYPDDAPEPLKITYLAPTPRLAKAAADHWQRHYTASYNKEKVQVQFVYAYAGQTAEQISDEDFAVWLKKNAQGRLLDQYTPEILHQEFEIAAFYAEKLQDYKMLGLRQSMVESEDREDVHKLCALYRKQHPDKTCRYLSQISEDTLKRIDGSVMFIDEVQAFSLLDLDKIGKLKNPAADINAPKIMAVGDVMQLSNPAVPKFYHLAKALNSELTKKKYLTSSHRTPIDVTDAGSEISKLMHHFNGGTFMKNGDEKLATAVAGAGDGRRHYFFHQTTQNPQDTSDCKEIEDAIPRENLFSMYIVVQPEFDKDNLEQKRRIAKSLDLSVTQVEASLVYANELRGLEAKSIIMWQPFSDKRILNRKLKDALGKFDSLNEKKHRSKNTSLDAAHAEGIAWGADVLLAITRVKRDGTLLILQDKPKNRDIEKLVNIFAELNTQAKNNVSAVPDEKVDSDDASLVNPELDKIESLCERLVSTFEDMAGHDSARRKGAESRLNALLQDDAVLQNEDLRKRVYHSLSDDAQRIIVGELRFSIFNFANPQEVKEAAVEAKATQNEEKGAQTATTTKKLNSNNGHKKKKKKKKTKKARGIGDTRAVSPVASNVSQTLPGLLQPYQKVMSVLTGCHESQTDRSSRQICEENQENLYARIELLNATYQIENEIKVKSLELDVSWADKSKEEQVDLIKSFGDNLLQLSRKVFDATSDLRSELPPNFMLCFLIDLQKIIGQFKSQTAFSINLAAHKKELEGLIRSKTKDGIKYILDTADELLQDSFELICSFLYGFSKGDDTLERRLLEKVEREIERDPEYLHTFLSSSSDRRQTTIESRKIKILCEIYYALYENEAISRVQKSLAIFLNNFEQCYLKDNISCASEKELDSYLRFKSFLICQESSKKVSEETLATFFDNCSALIKTSRLDWNARRRLHILLEIINFTFGQEDLRNLETLTDAQRTMIFQLSACIDIFKLHKLPTEVMWQISSLFQFELYADYDSDIIDLMVKLAINVDDHRVISPIVSYESSVNVVQEIYAPIFRLVISTNLDEHLQPEFAAGCIKFIKHLYELILDELVNFDAKYKFIRDSYYAPDFKPLTGISFEDIRIALAEFWNMLTGSCLSPEEVMSIANIILLTKDSDHDGGIFHYFNQKKSCGLDLIRRGVTTESALTLFPSFMLSAKHEQAVEQLRNHANDTFASFEGIKDLDGILSELLAEVDDETQLPLIMPYFNISSLARLLAEDINEQHRKLLVNALELRLQEMVKFEINDSIDQFHKNFQKIFKNSLEVPEKEKTAAHLGQQCLTLKTLSDAVLDLKKPLEIYSIYMCLLGGDSKGRSKLLTRLIIINLFSVNKSECDSLVQHFAESSEKLYEQIFSGAITVPQGLVRHLDLYNILVSCRQFIDTHLLVDSDKYDQDCIAEQWRLLKQRFPDEEGILQHFMLVLLMQQRYLGSGHNDHKPSTSLFMTFFVNMLDDSSSLPEYFMQYLEEGKFLPSLTNAKIPAPAVFRLDFIVSGFQNYIDNIDLRKLGISEVLLIADAIKHAGLIDKFYTKLFYKLIKKMSAYIFSQDFAVLFRGVRLKYITLFDDDICQYFIRLSSKESLDTDMSLASRYLSKDGSPKNFDYHNYDQWHRDFYVQMHGLSQQELHLPVRPIRMLNKAFWPQVEARTGITISRYSTGIIKNLNCIEFEKIGTLDDLESMFIEMCCEIFPAEMSIAVEEHMKGQHHSIFGGPEDILTSFTEQVTKLVDYPLTGMVCDLRLYDFMVKVLIPELKDISSLEKEPLKDREADFKKLYDFCKGKIHLGSFITKLYRFLGNRIFKDNSAVGAFFISVAGGFNNRPSVVSPGGARPKNKPR